MKYVLTVSPRVHDLNSSWQMMAPKSIYRDLIRLHAICFGVLYLLWANYGAKCQLNKGIIFVFVSGFSRDKHLTRSVSVCYIGFISQDLRSDAHISVSQVSHIHTFYWAGPYCSLGLDITAGNLKSMEFSRYYMGSISSHFSLKERRVRNEWPSK